MVRNVFRKIFRKAGSRLPERPDAPVQKSQITDAEAPLFDEPNQAAAPALIEAQTETDQDLPSYIGSALKLRDEGRFDEAERVLVAAVERFPTEPRPHLELAIISHARRDWQEAVRRWEILRGEFPNESLAWCFR